MKTETLNFKQLSPELEEVLTDKMASLKGGFSDGGFDWQDFYETHDQGTYEYSDGDFVFTDTEDQPMIIENGDYDMISFDGGETWGTLLAGDDEVTIRFDKGDDVFSDIVFEAEKFYDWATDDLNFNYEQFWENLGHASDLSELIAEGLNNPAAAKAFGKLAMVADAAGVAIDFNKLIDFYKNNEGNMDGVRFTLRTGTTTASIIAGSTVGGPPGIVVGVLISGSIVGTEFAYDTVLDTLKDLGGQFHNQFSNGWLPAQ